MKPEVRFRLEDMLQYALEARRTLGDRDAAAVLSDRLRELALIKIVEIIGEAAWKVPDEDQGILDSLPWRKIIGLRHVLVHGYGKVRMDELVRIVRDDLPPLIAALETFLKETPAP